MKALNDDSRRPWWRRLFDSERSAARTGRLPPAGAPRSRVRRQEDVVFARGLVPQAVRGKLLRSSPEGDALAMDNFVENNAFVVFLHDVVSRFAPGMVAFREQAKQLGAGHVYVIDGWTPTPQGDVPASDVIGAFRVEFGNVVAGSYTANPNHRLLSANGFFRLDPLLGECLLAELEEQTAANPPPPLRS